MEPNQPPSRPWRVIAKELTHEMSPLKVASLSAELSDAFDVQFHFMLPAEKSSNMLKKPDITESS